MLMMDTLKEGVLLINKAGEVCYANEPGNNFIKSGGLISGYLHYRNLAAEEIIDVTNNQQPLRIRINNFFWNTEQCNIFHIEKTEVVKQAIVIPTQVPQTTNEPFVSLMNYVQLISEHEANGRASEAAQNSELANKTIAQSEKLLSDIKAFIRMAGLKPALMQVSMQKIVGDVLKSMGPEIEEAEIEVSVSELPEAIADKELITNLLRHLINNALKFRNKNKKAIIDIGHDKSEGQYIFCVRDNGIGISKKHHEEVFNLFVSLNDQTEYPDNGMGLAVCKKIVELHDGKIWVESLPGHGSNFYFKLNAKQ
jgi:light-regulated signal transduction histidine kinase (bacteriophytochrome)